MWIAEALYEAHIHAIAIPVTGVPPLRQGFAGKVPLMSQYEPEPNENDLSDWDESSPSREISIELEPFYARERCHARTKVKKNYYRKLFDNKVPPPNQHFDNIINLEGFLFLFYFLHPPSYVYTACTIVHYTVHPTNSLSIHYLVSYIRIRGYWNFCH